MKITHSATKAEPPSVHIKCMMPCTTTKGRRNTKAQRSRYNPDLKLVFGNMQPDTPTLCSNPTQEPLHKQQIRIRGWQATGRTHKPSPRPTTGPWSPAPQTAFLAFPPRTTLPTSPLPSNPYLQAQYCPWRYDPDVQHTGSSQYQA